MIQGKGVTVHYGKTLALWDLDFFIPKGVIAGILGPNGAGKSTLLKAIVGLIQPLSGKIVCEGKIAYVPQRESIDWDFPITALEVVMMGRFANSSLWRRLKKADREAAFMMLEQVGMGPCANRQIGQLSGGQQQKLFIARALLQEAPVLFFDEPFSGVDVTTEKAILQILKKQAQLGKTILMVHHDLATVKEYFDWSLLLNRRLIACGPTERVFTQEHLKQTFQGHALFDDVAFRSFDLLQGEKR